jgi:hypothetical protein
MKYAYKAMYMVITCFLILFFGAASLSSFPMVFAQAEYDEQEDEREEREDEEDQEDDERDVATIEESVVTETITVSETEKKEIVTTTKSDKDGDGVFDDEDRYPEVNDHFIVTDDDRNGIVDTYEKK